MARVAKEITFEEPIKVGSKEIEKVTMRVPKGKDLKAVSHIPNIVDRDLTLAGNLCDLTLTPEEWDEVDGAEIQILMMNVRGFLTYTPKS